MYIKKTCLPRHWYKQTNPRKKTLPLESRPIWAAFDRQAFETCHNSAEFKKRNRFRRQENIKSLKCNEVQNQKNQNWSRMILRVHARAYME